MSLADLSPLANHLWQSTLFVGVAGLSAFLLRSNRAQVRYWLWVAASMKFLIPFAALVAVGRQFSWQSTTGIVQPDVTFVIDALSQPFSRPELTGVPFPTPSPNVAMLPFVLFAVWLCGCAMHLLAWWVRWQRVSAVVRGASPLEDARALEALRRLEGIVGTRQPIAAVTSDMSLEPGVFGILTPILVWPRRIGERLADRQLEAILAHELCHVRRRDNLVAAVHMLVEAMFWFHPLVWWIGSRLIEERERACDEEVVRLGANPATYAEAILDVCRFYLKSTLTCVAGVTGANLKKRVEHIVSGKTPGSLDSPGKALLAFVIVAAVAAPTVVGLMQPGLRAEPQAEPKMAFEVISVRPSPPNNRMQFNSSPGRFMARSANVKNLVVLAYGVREFQISGGPAWVTSDRFDISATSEKAFPTSDERGAMLRGLLKERFHLVVRQETRELPVYGLVIAKGGPKLKESSEDATLKLDGGPGRTIGSKVSMPLFSQFLSQQLSRGVVDRTGLAGSYEVQLTWNPQINTAPDGTLPGADGPSLFTALQDEMGLKLEPQRGPVPFIVIISAEKPTEN